MRLRLGCELQFQMPAATPLVALRNVHYSQVPFLERPDVPRADPPLPLQSYRDGFGNWCARLVAPAGSFTLGTDGVIHVDGEPDPQVTDVARHAVEDPPSETVAYLLPSRYCYSDCLPDEARRLFGQPPPYPDMDRAAWMECWLGGAWHTFDPKNLTPLRGRVLITPVRDAADVPLTRSFGPNTLTGFQVWIDEATA